ncbi:hypothetical protein MP228_001203 [Amoeboaphelidium protococcarum]|nr:hypothetical protein MP228_001203 [Amoeboaphelidium protococcarum]
MIMQSLLVASLLLLSHVYARYAVIDPGQNTTWQVNQQVGVRWQINEGGPAANFLSVELITGPPSKVMYVTTLCNALSPQSTYCGWTVPDYLFTSTYSIRISYNNAVGNAQPDYDYGSPFQIIGTATGNASTIARPPAPQQCIGPCGRNVTDPSNGASNSLLHRSLTAALSAITLLVLC